MPVSYDYNPHRHLKIWLSLDRYSFLNLKNQLRLIEMRSLNKKDEIYFLYDRSLLSEQAEDELKSFCFKYELIIKEVGKDIIPYSSTPEELNLIKLYLDEITHLEEGGNVAAASDILRWLSPVWRLGTYTDFDVSVDTRGLGSRISVKNPILLNIKPNFYSQEGFGLEGGGLNNDIVAIVDEQAAEASIKKIQEAIYARSSNSKLVEKACYKRQSRTRELNIVYKLNFIEQEKKPCFILFLSFLKLKKSSRELRYDFMKITQTDLDFAKWILLREKINYINLAEEKIIEHASIFLEKNDFFITLSKPEVLGGKKIFETARKALRTFLIKNSVMYTSGPGLIASILFPEIYYYRKLDDERKMALFSFQHYQLSQAFVSLNGTQDNAENQQELSSESNLKISNDASWLETGKEEIRQHEEKLKAAALKIKDFYQSIQEKKRQDKRNKSLVQSFENSTFLDLSAENGRISTQVQNKLSDKKESSKKLLPVIKFFDKNSALRQLRKDLTLELLEKVRQKGDINSLELGIDSQDHFLAFMGLTAHLLRTACKSAKIRGEIVRCLQNKDTFIQLIKHHSNTLKLEILLSSCKKEINTKIIPSNTIGFAHILNALDMPQFHTVAKIFFPRLMTVNFKFKPFLSRIDSNKIYNFILAIKEYIPKVVNIDEFIEILQKVPLIQSLELLKKLKVEFLELCWRYDQWLKLFKNLGEQEELSLTILDIQEDLAQKITTTAEFLELSSYLKQTALIRFITILKPRLSHLINNQKEFSQVKKAFFSNQQALEEVLQILRENFPPLNHDSDDFLDLSSDDEGSNSSYLRLKI